MSNIFESIVVGFVAGTNPNLSERIDRKDIVVPYRRKFSILSDGDLFELGGLTLEIIACPGHTYGSVMVLIKELRVIIFGDCCNPYVWLHLNESTSVAEYKKSLLRIKAREGDYDSVLLSHNPREVGKEILDEIIHLCDDIIAGKCDDIPFDNESFKNAYVAKRESVDDNNIRADGIVGNIVYKK